MAETLTATAEEQAFGEAYRRLLESALVTATTADGQRRLLTIALTEWVRITRGGVRNDEDLLTAMRQVLAFVQEQDGATCADCGRPHAPGVKGVLH